MMVSHNKEKPDQILERFLPLLLLVVQLRSQLLVLKTYPCVDISQLLESLSQNPATLSRMAILGALAAGLPDSLLPRHCQSDQSIFSCLLLFKNNLTCSAALCTVTMLLYHFKKRVNIRDAKVGWHQLGEPFKILDFETGRALTVYCTAAKSFCLLNLPSPFPLAEKSSAHRHWSLAPWTLLFAIFLCVPQNFYIPL